MTVTKSDIPSNMQPPHNYFIIKSSLILGISLTLLFSSCRQQSATTATVTAALADADGIKLVLQELDTREIHPVDSVVVNQDAIFNFTPAVNEPGFWLLKAPSGKVLVMLLNAGDAVELSGSLKDFPDNIIMKAPREAMLLNDFYKKTRSNERLVDSLEMLLSERQDSSDYYQFTQKLDTSFKIIWENQRGLEIAFIERNPGSLASLVVLNYAFGMSPVLSLEEDSAYYIKLDSALSDKFPTNKHVKLHHQRVLEYRNRTTPKT
ncbi:MAG: hypothetical protein ACOYNC_17340 [Bacteroidales bacterium]